MKEERGQITIEAIIIFGMLILILVAISWPMAWRARNAANDVTMVSDARYATEQIASAANSIVVPGGKRTIEVYVPGYLSPGNTTGGVPLTHIATRICSPDGSNLVTTVIIMRRASDGAIKREEEHNFTTKLYGSNWSFSVGGEDAIVEDRGKRYTLELYWKNITSTTSNSLSNVTCNQTGAPAGF